MARRAVGKIKIQLMDTQNESFNEYPCYTSKNFLDENATSSQDAEDFVNAWEGVVDDLSNNTYIKTDIDYTVNVDGLIE